MNIKRQLASCLLLTLAVISLSGCGAKDKSAATEATTNFMEALKTGNQDDINNYSSSEVATGNFVQLFDENYIKDELTSGLGDTTLNDDTNSKLEEFNHLYSSMMEEYNVTDVTMNDNGTATAFVTIKNSFPFDVITNESVQEKINAAVEQYSVDNQEELSTITKEQGEDAAREKTYNDFILIATNIYEEEIASAEPITYMLALNLSKNEETGSWYVTSIQSYDSSIAGTGAPATKTDTSATEISSDSSTEDVLFESIPEATTKSSASSESESSSEPTN